MNEQASTEFGDTSSSGENIALPLRTGRRLSKTVLTVWLLLPIVIVTALWFSVDRKIAQPHPGNAAAAGGNTGAAPAGVTTGPGAVDDASLPRVPPAGTWTSEEVKAGSDGAGVRKLAYGRLERLKPAGTLTDDLKLIGENGVLVWLPPGYEGAVPQPRDYATLYVIGGGELFGGVTKGSGPANADADWRLDESLGWAISANELRDMVVVTVPLCGSDEQFWEVLRRVVSRVEETYPVSRTPELRLLAGGGEAAGRRALMVATAHPGAFRGVVAQSPALFDENRAFMRSIAAAKKWPSRVYIGIGEHDLGISGERGADGYAGLNQQNQTMLQGLAEVLSGRGVGPENRMLVFEQGVTATGSAWGKRTAEAVKFVLKE